MNKKLLLILIPILVLFLATPFIYSCNFEGPIDYQIDKAKEFKKDYTEKASEETGQQEQDKEETPPEDATDVEEIEEIPEENSKDDTEEKEADTSKKEEESNTDEEFNSNEDTYIEKDLVLVVDEDFFGGTNFFSKFKDLALRYNLDFLEDDVGHVNLDRCKLIVLIDPDENDLVEVYNAIKDGTKVVCYTLEWTLDSSQIIDLYGVSTIREVGFIGIEENALVLNGEYLADFGKGLNISLINKNASSIFSRHYYSSYSGETVWEKRYCSEETGKEQIISITKKVGKGYILFTPIFYAYDYGSWYLELPISDANIDNLDNEIFAQRIFEWALE